MEDESITEYTDYKGDTIRVHWSIDETKGCLEMIFWLLLPTIIAISEVIHG